MKIDFKLNYGPDEDDGDWMPLVPLDLLAEYGGQLCALRFGDQEVQVPLTSGWPQWVQDLAKAAWELPEGFPVQEFWIGRPDPTSDETVTSVVYHDTNRVYTQKKVCQLGREILGVKVWNPPEECKRGGRTLADSFYLVVPKRYTPKASLSSLGSVKRDVPAIEALKAQEAQDRATVQGPWARVCDPLTQKVSYKPVAVSGDRLALDEVEEGVTLIVWAVGHGRETVANKLASPVDQFGTFGTTGVERMRELNRAAREGQLQPVGGQATRVAEKEGRDLDDEPVEAIVVEVPEPQYPAGLWMQVEGSDTFYTFEVAPLHGQVGWRVPKLPYGSFARRVGQGVVSWPVSCRASAQFCLTSSVARGLGLVRDHDAHAQIPDTPENLERMKALIRENPLHPVCDLVTRMKSCPTMPERSEDPAPLPTYPEGPWVRVDFEPEHRRLVLEPTRPGREARWQVEGVSNGALITHWGHGAVENTAPGDHYRLQPTGTFDLASPLAYHLKLLPPDRRCRQPQHDTVERLGRLMEECPNTRVADLVEKMYAPEPAAPSGLWLRARGSEEKHQCVLSPHGVWTCPSQCKDVVEVGYGQHRWKPTDDIRHIVASGWAIGGPFAQKLGLTSEVDWGRGSDSLKAAELLAKMEAYPLADIRDMHKMPLPLRAHTQELPPNPPESFPEGLWLQVEGDPTRHPVTLDPEHPRWVTNKQLTGKRVVRYGQGPVVREPTSRDMLGGSGGFDIGSPMAVTAGWTSPENQYKGCGLRAHQRLTRLLSEAPRRPVCELVDAIHRPAPTPPAGVWVRSAGSEEYHECVLDGCNWSCADKPTNVVEVGHGTARWARTEQLDGTIDSWMVGSQFDQSLGLIDRETSDRMFNRHGVDYEKAAAQFKKLMELNPDKPVVELWRSALILTQTNNPGTNEEETQMATNKPDNTDFPSPNLPAATAPTGVLAVLGQAFSGVGSTIAAGAAAGAAVALNRAGTKKLSTGLRKLGASKKFVNHPITQGALTIGGPLALRGVLPLLGVRDAKVLGGLDLMLGAAGQDVAQRATTAVLDFTGMMLGGAPSEENEALPEGAEPRVVQVENNQ